MTREEWLAKPHIDWLGVRLTQNLVRPEHFGIEVGRVQAWLELDLRDDLKLDVLVPETAKAWMCVLVLISFPVVAGEPIDKVVVYDKGGDPEDLLRESAENVRQVLEALVQVV